MTFTQAQYIQVNRGYTATQLVKDIFLGSSCIDVDEESINLYGYANNEHSSFGYFEKGNSNFPMQNGILLTTGSIFDAVGPNNTIQSFEPSNWAGDRDLEEALEIRNTFDATVLEFEFTSNQDEQIIFDYIFASEQYLRTAAEGRCGYTDGFAFLIKEVGSRDDYANIALVPNTNLPVSVNTIYGTGGLCNPINPQYFRQFNVGNTATNFNGETITLQAIANVIPGRKYKLKLVIADQGNGKYDSGVFLKAGSFSGSKNLGEDLLISNGNALCFGETIVLNATTPNAVGYKWFRNGIEIPGERNASYTVNSTGNYEVEIELTSGCTIKGNIRIEYLAAATLHTTIFDVCDTELIGRITLNLFDYNSQIITSESPIEIKYFSNRLDAENNRNQISTLTLNSNDRSKSIFATIKINNCPISIHEITFNQNTLSQFNTIAPIEICDDLLDQSETINLEDYLSLSIQNPNDNYRFFATENDAKLNRNAISEQQIITSNTTYYVRFSQGDLCENIAQISFQLKSPMKSTTLVDQTICEGSITTLDAGIGFDSYLWLHNGATTQIINNVPVGVYKVRLESNGCVYTQTVEVFAAENPVIENIIVTGTTATVVVRNPAETYLYSLDNGPFQSSNVFYNVSLGNHTVAVKSAVSCNPVFDEFSIVNLVNFLSPNQDGINDILDYSDLVYKIKPKFQVFDRFGKLLFDGTIQNNFTWNGTFNGKKLPTGNYWYSVEWTEPGSNKVHRKTNSILIKSK